MLVCSGYTNREIARTLDGNETTIKRYLLSICDKLQVANRLELVLFAVHHGLLEED